MRLNYQLRKLYVKLNPLISIKSHTDRVQWIMRNKSLFQCGIPFFLEPWLNPDDIWIDGYRKRNMTQLIFLFIKNFIRHPLWYPKYNW